MESTNYMRAGKTGKTHIFTPFPRFRIAGGEAGKTGKSPLGVSPFPRLRLRGRFHG